MRSLVYIILMSAKNRLLEVFRKPAKLILYIFVILLITGLFILPMFTSPRETDGFLDIIWLKGILFILTMIFFILSIQKGLKSGDVIFDMNDVNLLFVSPVRAQNILLYGVIRMAGMAFLAGFFLLFQGNSLGISFGIRLYGVLIIFAGFITAVCLMHIISLIIYSLTNGNQKRKNFVIAVSVLMFLPMAASGILEYIQTGDLQKSLEELLRSPAVSWMPVAGWASSGITAFLSGDIAVGLLFLGVIAAVGIILITYILLSNPDYYEDVLVATETAFEKKRGIAQGQINASMTSGKKIKVAATGIKGFGVSSIFYKHLRESFRENRLGLWGLTSILMIAISAVFAVIYSFTGDTNIGIIIILQMLMWMQVFFIATGRGLKELYSHYIYLIPESSFKKIVWSNLEIVFRVLAESVFAFGITGIILKTSPLLIIAAIITFTLFSFLLLGVNYLSLRWTGADMSAGILVMIYLLAVIILMLPGLIAAITAGIMIEGWGTLVGLLILSVWEMVIALGCFALSKSILHNCDMPVVKIK